MQGSVGVTQRAGKTEPSEPDGGASLPCLLRMDFIKGSTSWNAYLRGGWVDAESVRGALDVCVGGVR